MDELQKVLKYHFGNILKNLENGKIGDRNKFIKNYSKSVSLEIKDLRNRKLKKDDKLMKLLENFAKFELHTFQEAAQAAKVLYVKIEDFVFDLEMKKEEENANDEIQPFKVESKGENNG